MYCVFCTVVVKFLSVINAYEGFLSARAEPKNKAMMC